jgi:hypothetical protein
MTSSGRIYKKLRDFRAGIEGVISFLKRTFGLDRGTWRGFASFRADVHSSVLACNLLALRDTSSLREPEIYTRGGQSSRPRGRGRSTCVPLALQRAPYGLSLDSLRSRPAGRVAVTGL